MKRLTKTKTRWWKKTPLVVERVGLINRVIRETLNESFESTLPTEYEILFDGNVEIYRFNVNDNSYDLEFVSEWVNKNTPLHNGNTIGDYVKSNKQIVNTVDVAFVPSEINMGDRDNHELYTKNTDRGEQFELMGRISYLIKEYIKNNPATNIFVIGKNTDEMKLKIYLKIFDNIFSNQFSHFEGDNGNYDEGSYYFIKTIN